MIKKYISKFSSILVPAIEQKKNILLGESILHTTTPSHNFLFVLNNASHSFSISLFVILPPTPSHCFPSARSFILFPPLFPLYAGATLT